MDAVTRHRQLRLAGFDLPDAVRLEPARALSVGVVERDLAHDGDIRHLELRLLGVAVQDPELTFEARVLIAALDEFTGEARAYNAATDPNFNIKHPRGPGGRFRNVIARVLGALEAWANGDGSDDPFKAFPDREPLRLAAKHRGIPLRRGAKREEIAEALKADVKAKRAGAKDAKPEAGKPVRFTLKSGKLRDLDVGVFSEGGKVSLWEVSDSGERRRRVALVDDLAGLEAWADEHGESELAGWARKERAAPETKAGDLLDDSAPREAKVQATADALGKLRSDIETENKIRAAYRAVQQRQGPSDWVTLADLRDELGEGVNRRGVDTALQRMERDSGINIVPQSNQKALTQADRDSAVTIGGQSKHAITIDDPSPRSAESDILAHLDEAELSRPELDALGERLGIDVSGVRGERAKAERIAAGLAGGEASIAVSKGGAGARVANLPPVQVHVDASSGSDVGRWRATRAEGLSGSQTALLAAVTDRVRTSGRLANGRLRTPDAPLHEQSIDELLGRVPLNAEKAAKAAAAADRHIGALDKAMEQSRLPTDAVLWRGIRPADVSLPDGDATGFEWTDPAYVGTSGTRDVAEGSFAQGALLRIAAPSGTRAIGIQGGGEHEVLLDRGLRFRVVADRRTPSGARELDVKIVGTAPDVPAKTAKKAAPSPLASEARTILANSNGSTYELEALLSGRSKRQLVGIAEHLGIDAPDKATAAQLRERIQRDLMPEAGTKPTGRFNVMRLNDVLTEMAEPAVDLDAAHSRGAHASWPDVLDASPGRSSTASEASREALHEYKSDDKYRELDYTTEDSTIKGVRSAMRPIESDVVVWRGERSLNTKVPRGALSRKGGMEGVEWTGGSFSSTSADEAVARDFALNDDGSVRGSQPVLMRLRVPAGTRAVAIDSVLEREGPDDITGYLKEQELLLADGLRYRITKDYGVVRGVRQVDVEVLPQPAKATKAAKKAAPTAAATKKAAAIRERTKSDMAVAAFTVQNTPSYGTAEYHGVSLVDHLRTLDPEAARDQLDLIKVGTVDDPNTLKWLLREQGLPVSGKKRDLVDRLVESLAQPTREDTSVPVATTSRSPRQLSVGTRIKLKPNAGSFATLGRITGVTGEGPTAIYDIEALDDEGRRYYLSLSRDKFTLNRSEGRDAAEIERAEDEDLEDDEVLDEEADDPTLDEIHAMAAEDHDERTTPPEARARELALLGVTRAAGHDVTPGRDELHHWWVWGEGRARWKTWTDLFTQLAKIPAVGPLKARVFASKWFLERYHYAAGSDINRVKHGKPPRGKRVGPG